MCGINVLFEDSPEKLEAMNTAIKYRGLRSRIHRPPDSRQWWGHVRLPIQDLSPLSDQPMIYRNVVGMFVGEIFNYRELSPDARTDLPVLMDLFLDDRMDEADGFWSAAFRIDDLTIVTTDPLGKKPMYYRKTGPRGISSEMGSLLTLGPVTPDELYYSTVAKWGYCSHGRTPFLEITKLPPGKVIVFDDDGLIISLRDVNISLEPQRGDLYSLMEQSVRNRTVSDVPIAVLLSGGLDSTIVFELLKKTEVPFTAYHIENDEAHFLEYLDFPSHVTLKKLNPAMDEASWKEGFMVGLDDILSANGCPVDLGSMVPQYRMAQALNQDGVHVVLTGDGADELFGGYGRASIYDSQYSDVFHELTYYHLPRLDKLMMRWTVELRSPFLALPVIRHALSLPWHWRTTKQELKSVFRNIIPHEILSRRKEPLKIKTIRTDEMSWRLNLIKKHRRMMWGI
jgi:asparagine synthase (glutamine-hydrolysing)